MLITSSVTLFTEFNLTLVKGLTQMIYSKMLMANILVFSKISGVL